MSTTHYLTSSDAGFVSVSGGSATVNAVPRYDSTTGLILADSLLIVDNAGDTQTPGDISGGSLSTTGVVNAGSVDATGDVFGTSLTTTGAVSADSVTATGTVTGGSLSTTGAVNAGSILTNTLQVTSPNYNFIECGSTGGQSLSNNAVQSLTFWGVNNTLGTAIVKADDVDPLDNNYDFIVLEDGIYSVEATVTFNANASGERVLIIYIQGGNKGHELDSATAPNAKRMHVTARDFMVAGDRIRLAAFQNSGAALSIGTSAGLNRLTIFKEQ